MQTIENLLHHSIAQLQSCSATPQLDAELLLAKILQVTPAYLHTFPEQKLSAENIAKFALLLQRRLQAEPIAYILERQGFWNFELKVTRDTLIPRPETELLVELALKKLSAQEKLKIADLGTGSGAIALALAAERSQWSLTATDQSQAALIIAKQNAFTLNLKNINFYHGNWCHALTEKYHAIISNPPYIAKRDSHLNHLSFEPQAALVSGEDGLEAIRCIISQARDYLVTGGLLMLEHGYDQTTAVRELLENAGYQQISSYQDLSGYERVTTCRWVCKESVIPRLDRGIQIIS